MVSPRDSSRTFLGSYLFSVQGKNPITKFDFVRTKNVILICVYLEQTHRIWFPLEASMKRG